MKEGELRRERRGRRAWRLETQVQVAVRPSSVIVPPAAVDPPDCRIEAYILGYLNFAGRMGKRKSLLYSPVSLKSIAYALIYKVKPGLDPDGRRLSSRIPMQDTKPKQM